MIVAVEAAAVEEEEPHSLNTACVCTGDIVDVGSFVDVDVDVDRIEADLRTGRFDFDNVAGIDSLMMSCYY